MGNITTGIDRLLSILKENKKLSVSDLSKKLNVEKDVVEEWIELLVEEKMVVSSYKLSQQYVELSSSGVSSVKKIGESSAKKISSERDAFKRKIDATIHELESETAGFEELRHHYTAIQSSIKDELRTVRMQMLELEHFDALKKNVAKDIEKQQKDYQKFVSHYHEQVKKYEDSFKIFVSDLAREQKRITDLHKRISLLRKNKEDAEKVLDEAMTQLRDVSKELNSHITEIKAAEKRTGKIQHGIESLEKGAENKKEEFLAKLAKRIGSRKDDIDSRQRELLRSAKDRIDLIRSYAMTGRKAYERFDVLFKKKIKTLDMFDDIDKEKVELIRELHELKKKVEAFTVLRKYSSVKKQIGDIEKVMIAYEKKKNSLVKKIHSLVSFINH